MRGPQNTYEMERKRGKERLENISVAFNFVIKERTPIEFMSAAFVTEYYHLLPPLKQNLGCYIVEDNGEVVTVWTRWPITQDTDFLPEGALKILQYMR